jgi:hypothetical protein
VDVEERLTRRYRAALDLGVHTSPGTRADVGERQQIEVVHVLPDAFQTVVFCRVHGGPPTESPHFGPFVQPLDPPELGEAISTTRWQGFEVVHLGPVLPFHRTITLALGPAIPGDRPPEVVWQRMQRLRERPDGVLTIPVG